jgi:hypothetical protein
MPQSNESDTESIPRPEGEGWAPRGKHWEREVEDRPCAYCGSIWFIESTYAWPYCASCGAT